MSGRMHRHIRGQAKHIAAEQAKALVPTLRALDDNENLTRKRVDVLEESAREVEALMNRDFRGRLRWLLLGR